MSLDSLKSLYEEDLKDLYSAERLLTKALPKMAKGASNPKLKKAFDTHLKVTETHITRLERAFSELGMKPKSKPCKGMMGLIEEGKEVLEEDGEPEVKDAGLIVAAQKVEHYEAAAYGSMRTFAEMLGLKNSARLFQQTLDEEKYTDKLLTQLAESDINWQAKNGEDMQESRRSSSKSNSRGKSASSSSSRSKSASSGSRSSASKRNASSSTSRKSATTARASSGSKSASKRARQS
jgi:ferritin-like metal-binding protein YciE